MSSPSSTCSLQFLRGHNARRISGRGFILSGALRDGETGPRDVRGTEGGSINVTCSFLFGGIGRKLFCKEECKEEDVLVGTAGFQAQNGRYSLTYTKDSLLMVSIAQLVKSDAGRYRCGVRRPIFPDSYEEFEVFVTDDSHLVLVLCVTALVVVLLAVVLLLYKKERKDSDGSNKKGISDSTGAEIVPYGSSPPDSTCGDSTYQSLDPARRDPDHIYCTLTPIKHK